MTKSRTPEDFLAGLSGWSGASVSELAGGLTNQVWLVTKDDRKAILKLDRKRRDAPFHSRNVEARIQQRAADWGIASTILYADDETLLATYVEGSVWNAGQLESPGNIVNLAAAMRRLHSLPLTGHSFDAIAAARMYAADTRLPGNPLVEHCVRFVGAQPPPQGLRCCHNDLVAENIIASPEIIFLDWEYACDNDPLYDLASVVEYHDLDDGIVMQLLNAYFDGAGERHLHALQEQRRLYRALLWLWLATRPGTRETELDAVAERIDF